MSFRCQQDIEAQKSKATDTSDGSDGKALLLTPKVFPSEPPSQDKEMTLTEKSSPSRYSDTDTSRCTSVSEESSDSKSRNVSTDSEDSGEVQGILTSTPGILTSTPRSRNMLGIIIGSPPRSEDDTTSSPDM